MKESIQDDNKCAVVFDILIWKSHALYLKATEQNISNVNINLMFSSLYQRSGCNLSILMLQMFINDYMIKILITHPPLWMQLYGDAGVFVPDESDPSAWH